ncbi:pseudouridine synthase [Methylobacterium radiodurans]|nr:pseudouridine synthase [Methylobacterium radiodurans]
MRGKLQTRSGPPPVSLSRVLSKFGFCSRGAAEGMIQAGRVQVDGHVVRDADRRVDPQRSAIRVDGRPVKPEAKVYLMLNKPRGLLTTCDDPLNRGTVYDCLAGHGLPFLGPVGRLDRASEGLLLLTNDTRWSQHLLDPTSNIDKVYHVRIDRLPDEGMLARLQDGVIDEGEELVAKSARLLRSGERNAWLEVVLSEGKNRQIRRLMAQQGANVLRLVRVAVGGLPLGDIRKGEFRLLTEAERLSVAGDWRAAGNTATAHLPRT